MFTPATALLKRCLALIGIALLVATLSACGPDQPTLAFKGSDITGSHLGKDLDMVDSSGQARTLKDYRGKVLVGFFGFTQCPDICPTAMTQLSQAVELLGPDASKVQVAMITVDPQRDTPEVLTEYVRIFHDDFIGLTGTPEQLGKTAKSFKAFYARVPGAKPDQYTMDHSSSFYIIDPQGEARSLMRGDATPEELAHDIRLVLPS